MVQTVADHCDFYLLVDKVVDAPVVQVVPRSLSCRQMLMVQTLQKTVEVLQLQLVDSTSLSWCRDRFPWSCSGP